MSDALCFKDYLKWSPAKIIKQIGKYLYDVIGLDEVG